MCLEAGRRVCMLDRAGGYSNETFRFSTTEKQWEQLDASQGSSPSAVFAGDYYERPVAQDMVAVGSDLYVLSGLSFWAQTGIWRLLGFVSARTIKGRSIDFAQTQMTQDAGLLAIVYVHAR